MTEEDQNELDDLEKEHNDSLMRLHGGLDKEGRKRAEYLSQKIENEGQGMQRCNCCKCKNCNLEHNHWSHDGR